jgi:hypothetical protein
MDGGMDGGGSQLVLSFLSACPVRGTAAVLCGCDSGTIPRSREKLVRAASPKYDSTYILGTTILLSLVATVNCRPSFSAGGGYQEVSAVLGCANAGLKYRVIHFSPDGSV